MSESDNNHQDAPPRDNEPLRPPTSKTVPSSPSNVSQEEIYIVPSAPPLSPPEVSPHGSGLKESSSTPKSTQIALEHQPEETESASIKNEIQSTLLKEESLPDAPPNGNQKHNNLQGNEISIPSEYTDKILARVTPSNVYATQPQNTTLEMSQVEARSRTVAYHAHFEDGSWHSHEQQSVESSSDENRAEYNINVPPQNPTNRTNTGVQTLSEELLNLTSSHQKPSSTAHENTVTPHTVRSTTISSQVPPQRSYPEQVFSEPTPFGQIYPPQRCESRSCAMRRSAYNAMACTMPSNTTTPITPNLQSPRPSTVNIYPTEPVLIEMNSGEQTSSTQSDNYISASQWNDASTIPATSTPSGRSTSDDMYSCLGSSVICSLENISQAQQNPSTAPIESRKEEVGSTTAQGPSLQLLSNQSDEELIGLLSPAPAGNSTGQSSRTQTVNNSDEGSQKQETFSNKSKERRILMERRDNILPNLKTKEPPPIKDDEKPATIEDTNLVEKPHEQLSPGEQIGSQDAPQRPPSTEPIESGETNSEQRLAEQTLTGEKTPKQQDDPQAKP